MSSPIDTPSLRLAPPAGADEDARLCSDLLAELRGDASASVEAAAVRFAAAAEFLIGLDPATGSAERVECLLAVAQFFYLAARPAAALPAADRAVEQARALGNRSLLRKALTFSGVMRMDAGNLPEATACFSEALALAQQLGDAGAEAPV